MSSDGWITIREGLPEEYPVKGYKNRRCSDYVLVTEILSNGSVKVWTSRLENGVWGIEKYMDDVLVVAWKPLPEAWKPAYDLADYLYGER